MSEFAGTTWTVIGLTLLPTALAHQLLPVTSLSQSAPNRTHARVRESLCAFVALRDSARVAQTASLISLAAVGTTERPSVTMAGADASKKIIAVIGCNGAQGGVVADALLRDGTFKVRALVRNVEGAQAQGSRDRGAEVAAADVYDAKSLEEAVKGCHGLFVVTFLHPHTDPEREHKQCQNAAQAAKAAGIQHVVFSTLPDTRLPRFRDFYDSASFPKVTLRDMKVPHYDCKAECEAFFADFPIKTFVMAGAYYSNLYKYGFLSRNERTGGKLAVTLCVDRDTVYPGMDLEDFGKVVAGVFKAGAAADNERVYVVSDPMTVGEVMDVVGKVTGEEVVPAFIDRETYSTFFPGADDLANMFYFYGFPSYRAYVEEHRQSGLLDKYCRPTPFAEWAARHREELLMKGGQGQGGH